MVHAQRIFGEDLRQHHAWLRGQKALGLGEFVRGRDDCRSHLRLGGARYGQQLAAHVDPLLRMLKPGVDVAEGGGDGEGLGVVKRG